MANIEDCPGFENFRLGCESGPASKAHFAQSYGRESKY